MAQPTIVFERTTSETTPVWVDIDTNTTITFTGAGSADGDLKPIPVPTGANLVRIADELWVDTSTDIEITIYADDPAPGQETDSYTVDMFASNPTTTNTLGIRATVDIESQAGELEAWDNTSFNSTINEILAGTTNLGVHSQLRAVETAVNVISTTGIGAIPAGYSSQAAVTTTYQLQGDTRSLTFSAAIGTVDFGNRIAMHVFVVDDSTAGASSCELTYKYYYT
ncbi:hypothetical protein LCGC14_0267240 [marine sediment metagenome]|uniref:Uncharacterized protein n=1 Tax=marine sediment metagenome TaxID=412755 RepID=A0A0F9X4R9_9ZZZZ